MSFAPLLPSAAQAWCTDLVSVHTPFLYLKRWAPLAC